MPRRARRWFSLPLFGLILLFAGATAQAADQGIADISSEPGGAQVYVNGKLKGTTPTRRGQTLPVALDEGNYTIEARLGGKRASQKVFVGAGTFPPVHLVLSGGGKSAPSRPVAATPTDIDALLHPKQDSFETDAEFAARKQRFLDQFNAASGRHDPAVQAGTITLDKEAYDVNAGVFPFSLELKAWARNLGVGLPSNKLKAGRDTARALWQEGAEKPLFVRLEAGSSVPAIKAFAIIGLAKEWGRDSLVIPKVDEPKMVKIPAGCFQMGSPKGEKGRDSDEGPVHRVCLDAFEMGRYEVTFAEWDACVDAGGCSHRPDDEGWGRGDRPVINVSWEDAQAYIGWLNQTTGRHYRLPTEAEWEYAARAGTDTAYFWGDAVGRNNANCDGCGSRWDDKKTAPVGSFAPNAWGLHDLHGNVWEWCGDWYESNYYANSPNKNPRGPASGKSRVRRGGSWHYSPSRARSATRGLTTPSTRYRNTGFRVVRRAR